MSEMKAIETEYAGCRFRSRLEARWAVFFDNAGIEWQYEHEGLELPSGRYLPDFRISGCLTSEDHHIWAEVKGDLTHAAFSRLIRAVMEMPPTMKSAPISPQVIVLGNIPPPGEVWAHARISTNPEFFVIHDVVFEVGDKGAFQVPISEPIPYRLHWLNYMDTPERSAPVRKQIMQPGSYNRLALEPIVDNAYRAARSARFEFGESG